MDQSGGVLALGCAQVEGLTFTPVDGDAGYYQVKVTSLTYGDQAISLSGTYDPPILDSGTTLLMLPNAMYNSVLSLVCAQLAPLLDSSGFTCDETTLNNNALVRRLSLTFYDFSFVHPTHTPKDTHEGVQQVVDT